LQKEEEKNYLISEEDHQWNTENIQEDSEDEQEDPNLIATLPEDSDFNVPEILQEDQMPSPEQEEEEEERQYVTEPDEENRESEQEDYIIDDTPLEEGTPEEDGPIKEEDLQQ